MEGKCLLIERYFCTGCDYGEKADLSKGCWNPKRKLWVIMDFPEIIRQPYMCISKKAVNYRTM